MHEAIKGECWRNKTHSISLIKLYHILFDKCISYFFIIFSHSNSCNYSDFWHIWIICLYNLFGSFHHFFSESHMLSTSIGRSSNRKLIAKNMNFSYDSSILKNWNKVRTPGKIIRRDTKTEQSENRSVIWIDILEKVFMPTTRFIKIFLEYRIMGIISFCPDFSRGNIMASNSLFFHFWFRQLS